MSKQLARLQSVLWTGARYVFAFLSRSIGLLASAPDPSAEEDRLNSAARGGDFNFRKGEFDDGTDPAGWYGRD
jgi:hypothetical protein